DGAGEAEAYAAADMVIGVKLTDANPKLSARVFQVPGAGYDGVDLSVLPPECTLCNCFGHEAAIAEYVMAALLEGEKRLGAALSTTGTTGDAAIAYGTLQGKVLAIAGFGAVGQEIAKRALGFDMVLRSIRRSGPGMAEGVEFAPSLEALIDGADMMVIALPQTEATTGAVNAALLAHATPHLHLINIARGSIVDQDALVDFLAANPLARATLDVTTPEPLPDDHPLMTHPQARITPHIAWRNPDFRERNLLIFRETLAALIAGAPLPGRVDPAQGY
uniref:NAD(P)-dependent oxidoreductase n=1 Tax=Actibacterium sp. TaxID=1872125 RepID=UPI00356A8208